MSKDDGIALIADARRSAGDGKDESYESAAWARLSHAADVHGFAANWLDIQCRALDGVIRGIVILRASEGAAYAPVAVWPDQIEGSPKLAAYAVRFHGLIADIIGPLIVIAIAIPFAVSGVRVNPAVGVSKSIGLFFLYYVFSTIATSLATKGVVDPLGAAWLPNAGMAAIAGWAYAQTGVGWTLRVLASEDALDALARQTQRPDRLIVIDNCSTDRTRQMVEARTDLACANCHAVDGTPGKIGFGRNSDLTFINCLFINNRSTNDGGRSPSSRRPQRRSRPTASRPPP